MDVDKVPLETQQETLKKLKSKLHDIKVEAKDEKELIRFLKARQFDVDRAFDMYTNHLEWRKENKIDEIKFDVEKDPLPMPTRGYLKVRDQNPSMSDEHQKRFYRFYGGFCFHKYDKDGHPIYIERSGLINTNMIAKYVSLDVILPNHYRSQKLLHDYIMDDCQKMFSKNIETGMVILDCQGVGMHQMVWPAIKMLKTMSEIDQLHYPERLHSMYCVNVPSVFKVFYDIGKKWVDQRVLSKIHILTAEETKEALLKVVAEEHLPEYLGGKCKCSHIEGGCVPNFCVETDLLHDSFDHQIVIKARDKFVQTIQIKEIGPTPSFIRWSFATKSHDIKFGVTLEVDKSVKELIVAKSYDSHEVTISDFIEVKEKGTYHFIWDNSYSLFRQKELMYSVVLDEFKQ